MVMHVSLSRSRSGCSFVFSFQIPIDVRRNSIRRDVVSTETSKLNINLTMNQVVMMMVMSRESLFLSRLISFQIAPDARLERREQQYQPPVDVEFRRLLLSIRVLSLVLMRIRAPDRGTFSSSVTALSKALWSSSVFIPY